jgi:very-short-patch-repair endonuclease
MCTGLSFARSMGMNNQRPPYLRYRWDLRARGRKLRHDPTPPERKLWYEFLSMHKEKFTRQKPLGTYIADFYCAEKQLVIEIDGDSHFTNKCERYDATRTSVLASSSLRVLRFTNTEVMQQFEAVCQQIEDALQTSENKKPKPPARLRLAPPLLGGRLRRRAGA